MEIEIQIQLYKLLLIEAAKTGSAVEAIAEHCFKEFMERNNNDVDQRKKRNYRQD